MNLSYTTGTITSTVTQAIACSRRTWMRLQLGVRKHFVSWTLGGLLIGQVSYL